MKVYLILFLATFAFAKGASVPSFFQKCPLNDENTKKCLTDSINNGWPQLVEGDNNWNELPIKDFEDQIENLLHGSFTNGKLIGLANTHFEEINIDTKKKIFTVIFTCPRLSIVGTVNVTANLSGVRLHENSPINETLSGGVYNFRFRYQLDTRDDEQYIKIYKQELIYNLDRLIFDLKIEDQSRAARANKLFNDNWKLINNLGFDIYAKLLANTIATKIQELLHNIPFNTLFE